MLEWAVRRSGRTEGELWNKSNPRSRFEKWLSGEKHPTYKQLQDFARRTYTPFGYLLLGEPVDEPKPIADFRHVAGQEEQQLSVNLLDVIHACQDRLDWWRTHRQLTGEPAPSISGVMTLEDKPAVAAASLAEALGWSPEVRRSAGSWDNALAELRDRAEAVGVLVVISGVVGANTSRALDVDEFRGFALLETGDALVFINGRDAKAAQIFTLAHELAHVLLAEQGISSLESNSVLNVETESWCNSVAAEMLVPGSEFRTVYERVEFRREAISDLARHFRVSGQVILGRFRELGFIDWDTYFAELVIERARVAEILESKAESDGGNFYNSKPVQLSKRFTQELIGSTLEGHTPYSEAFRLLGVKKAATFDNLSEKLGVI